MYDFRLLWLAFVVNASVELKPLERAEKMLAQMTVEEKLRMMRGSFSDYVGNVEGNVRLGIPALNIQDGPQGFRITKKTGEQGSSTAWPSSLNIASSFDPHLAYRWAVGIAEEFVLKGANMQLSPGLGLARVPTAGRNFEYLCGEDPYLGSILGYQVHLDIYNNVLCLPPFPTFCFEYLTGEDPYFGSVLGYQVQYN
jgi:beta-glucosidase-like glycosyl hydrolase